MQIKVSVLKPSLVSYPNREAAQVLERDACISQILIRFYKPTSFPRFPLLVSAPERPDITLTRLQNEIDLGGSPVQPFPYFQCSLQDLSRSTSQMKFHFSQHLLIPPWSYSSMIPQGQGANFFFHRLDAPYT